MSAIWSSMSLNLIRICKNETMMFSIWCLTTTTATTTTLPWTTTTPPIQICMQCCHATSLQLAPAAASDWGSHSCCHISLISSNCLLLFIVAVSENSDKQGQGRSHTSPASTFLVYAALLLFAPQRLPFLVVLIQNSYFWCLTHTLWTLEIC